MNSILFFALALTLVSEWRQRLWMKIEAMTMDEDFKATLEIPRI